MSTPVVDEGSGRDSQSHDTPGRSPDTSFPAPTSNTGRAVSGQNSQTPPPLPRRCESSGLSDVRTGTGDTEKDQRDGQEQQQPRVSGNAVLRHQSSSSSSRNGGSGRAVSWQSSGEPDEVLVMARPSEQVSGDDEATAVAAAAAAVAAAAGGPEETQMHETQDIDGVGHDDDGMQRGQSVAAGAESATSSLYAVSASLVGGIMTGASSINGNASVTGMGMGGVPLSGGTLSPQYTLVNSDGASLRVHTGSIRERNLNRRISAIHEDDSDAYSESRRSDSLVFVHSLSPSSSVLQRRRYRLYSHQQQQHQQHQQQHQQPMTTTPSDAMLRGRVSEDDASVYYAGAGAACGIGNGAGMADVAGDAAAGGMARALGESDCFSMVSGISEGGASTTRVRMATDRAYDALRIGPSNNAAYGYGHGGQYYPHRPMSFATSSDPGLPSAGSYYDYYLGPDDYVPPSSAFPDDSDFNDDQSGEIISLIRSDVAVYSGAGDDVKFPFLPDNFSELGASIVYSPGGALSVDLDRLSRDQSDFSYGTPAASNYYAYQTPEPSAAQQTMDSAHQGHHYHRLRPQMKLRKKGKGVKPPSVSSGHDGATGGGSGARETGQGLGAMAANAMSRPKISAAAGGGGSNPASPSSATNELHRRYTRRYRNQSASDAYHHHQTATQAAAQAVAEAVAASGGGSSSSPPMRADTGAIRPNALMRFIKRITPKN